MPRFPMYPISVQALNLRDRPPLVKVVGLKWQKSQKVRWECCISGGGSRFQSVTAMAHLSDE